MSSGRYQTIHDRNGCMHKNAKLYQTGHIEKNQYKHFTNKTSAAQAADLWVYKKINFTKVHFLGSLFSFLLIKGTHCLIMAHISKEQNNTYFNHFNIIMIDKMYEK